MAFKKYIETVDIVDIADRGKSVGKTKEGKVVFLSDGIPGDRVETLILKKRKGNLEGIMKNIIEYSEFRTDTVCAHFDICGGCKWQHFIYEKQLEYKDKQVGAALERIGKVNPQTFLPIVGCEKHYYYRNKLEFSFSNKRWLTETEIQSDIKIDQQNVLGFHAPGSFEKIVSIDHCHLQEEPSNKIRNFVRDFTLDKGYTYWDAKEHIGLMRNMIIRTANTGQVMVTIIFSKNEHVEEILNAVIAKFPDITSLNYVINSKFNDSIFDLRVVNYYGEKYIKEKLAHVEFIISPKSFFQTNTDQSVKLYDIAADFAGFTGDEHVLDLYTGIGSIALYIADKVKSVIGIELVSEAIEDARENAKMNDISNVEFIVGDVKKVLNENFQKPDIVIVDPPRAGLDKEVVDTIMQLSPDKIVYISCNPSTQARDIEMMKDMYHVSKSQAVDMFPHTHHIENIVLMVRKV